jgi:hypothetical protein
MKKKNLLLVAILTLGVVVTSCKKKGCTDENAANYSTEAKKDDGSCTYTTIDAGATTFVESGSTVTITDNGEGIGTKTLTADKVWILNKLVFVNSGQTLTIEAGTVIKGTPGQGENASALIVAKGATINAIGTATNPIIFTAESDDLNGSLAINARGLWGGLIVLGDAKLNSSPGTSAIEGIATSEARGLYGGTNDTDNSGTLQYVSIRHGGTDIGAGNEINGLTLGGVGSGTTIDHIEIVSNADDGIECFGGTPNIKNLVVSYCADDCFDYDEGFRGNIQFALIYQDINEGDRMGEHDGGTTPEDGAPYAKPVFYNATYIGRGISAGKRALTFRDNAGGEYHNSIIMNQGKGIDIEKLGSGQDAYARFTAGELVIANNVFYDVALTGATALATDLFTVSFADGVTDNGETAAFQATFGTNNNTVANPGIDVTASSLNPVPTNSANVSNAAVPTDSWFTTTSYQGAFDPSGSNWAQGWTLLFE